MPIEHSLYDTATLLETMNQLEAPTNYWLELCYPRVMTFTTKYIEFEQMDNLRKLAPFVVPTAQGRPIYTEGSNLTRIAPAYIKPKDAVEAAAMMGRKPGNLLAGTPRTPQQNWDAAVAARLSQHRDAIERRWEWMAAKAIIDGRITIVDEDSPERIIDFERDPSLEITLTGPARWNQAGADVINDIEEWRTLARNARFGGPITRLTVSADVWEVMRKNPELLKQLDTQIRGTQGSFITGVREGLSVEYVGRLSGTLDIYVYSDFYHDENGNVVPFMENGLVVGTGPNINGVRAFGAILDKKAGLNALPIFSKMWDQEDPSATFVMSQSAPLMVPVNINASFVAKVL